MTFSRLSDYGVTEITWENDQPAMHECGVTNETLESIVHHATTYYNTSQYQDIDLQTSKSLPRTHNINSNVASSSEKRVDIAASAGPSYLKKRPRSSATVHDQEEEECKNEGDTIRSQSSRQSRAAAIHNQSERRRRERINQKIKALQKLVPNANKTDKASMLDEVIDYLKKLQTQVQLMKNMSIPPPQMMIPVPLQLQQQQHHLQTSMLAQMGMGLGFQMGMPLPFQHPFVVPQTMASHNHSSTNSTDPLSDPHSAFLAQRMNTDMYNNMDGFFR